MLAVHGNGGAGCGGCFVAVKAGGAAVVWGADGQWLCKGGGSCADGATLLQGRSVSAVYTGGGGIADRAFAVVTATGVVAWGLDRGAAAADGGYGCSQLTEGSPGDTSAVARRRWAAVRGGPCVHRQEAEAGEAGETEGCIDGDREMHA